MWQLRICLYRKGRQNPQLMTSFSAVYRFRGFTFPPTITDMFPLFRATLNRIFNRSTLPDHNFPKRRQINACQRKQNFVSYKTEQHYSAYFGPFYFKIITNSWTMAYLVWTIIETEQKIYMKIHDMLWFFYVKKSYYSFFILILLHHFKILTSIYVSMYIHMPEFVNKNLVFYIYKYKLFHTHKPPV